MTACVNLCQAPATQSQDLHWALLIRHAWPGRHDVDTIRLLLSLQDVAEKLTASASRWRVAGYFAGIDARSESLLDSNL